jgi:hypothetical protein
MRTIRVLAVLGAVLAMAAVGAYGQDWLRGSPDEKLKTLADIQPGLGTVMIEYANRFTNAYYAAKGGNWDLAAYMVKEMREIQEVGETTRPARAAALKGFEKSYLDPLDVTIKAKDFKKFDTAFKSGIQGCNTCHTGQGFSYIKYQLPKVPPSPLVMKP